MKQDAVIIGGGVAGLWCAWELARLGFKSLIVEQNPYLGGNVAHLSCKATDRCQRCGACFLEDILSKVKSSSLVSIYLAANLVEVKRQEIGFSILLKHGHSNHQNKEVHARALIVASGFKPFDASEKPRFGYGRIPGVVTGFELELQLRENRWNYEQIKKIAFIQCVGSRDPKLGRNYCSHVCCGYAIRLAQLIRSRFPKIEISLFYMDIQSFDRDFSSLIENARTEMKFVRSIPSEVRASNGRPELIYHGQGEERIIEPFDMVVLSVGISPGTSTKYCAELLGLQLNLDGFLGTDGYGVLTNQPGIFVAGTSQGPKSIKETVSHASRAATEAVSYLTRNFIGDHT